MTPSDLVHIRQDIKELLKKVDRLSNRLNIVETDVDNIELLIKPVQDNEISSSLLCHCGSMPEEYCTCKLW